MRSMCWFLATYPIQARCRVPSLVRAECMKWHRDNPCLFRMWLKGLLPSSRRRLASPRADKACEEVLNGQARWQQNRLPSKKSRTIKLESAAVGPMFEHREEDFILRSRQPLPRMLSRPTSEHEYPFSLSLFIYASVHPGPKMFDRFTHGCGRRHRYHDVCG